VSVVTESEANDRIATEYKVGDDGRVVEIRFGDAIVARPESEEIAKRLDKVDLFALARVPLPRSIPRRVPGTVVYRILGLPAAFDKPDARQRFARDGAQTLLTVAVKEPLAADPRKDTPRAVAKVSASADDLAATPQIDWDAPGVKALAEEIAGNVPGSYAAALKLSQAVYRRLEKAYGASHDRASEVLAAGKGDCTEHSLLFVALARSLGIPARIVYGLVYAQYDDGVPALYWHAWGEVKSGGEWIAVDPIFDQPVADATHIALGSPNQADTVGLIGALKVTGVEVR
jgi:transglutaminase-like putative cysteine protease